MEWPTNRNHLAEHLGISGYLIDPSVLLPNPAATELRATSGPKAIPSSALNSVGLCSPGFGAIAPALVDGPTHPNPTTTTAGIPPAPFDQSSPLHAALPFYSPLRDHGNSFQSAVIRPKQQNIYQVPCLRNNPPPTSSFQCKWEGCRYPGFFNRLNALMRHVKNIHALPRTYPCPVRNCSEVFNRKDNLLEHKRRRHQQG